MLARRVVVCLDVHGGRVVKGEKFVHLRDVGDPVDLGNHEKAGATAQEIVNAPHPARHPLWLDTIR